MLRQNLSVENAKIIFRNFAGKESKFNRSGDRNFCVVFDKETGEQLKEDGWNMGILKPKDDYEDIAYRLQVSVKFGNFPPKIYMISGRHKIELTEDSVAALDYAEIVDVDLIIRPYNWEVNGKTGVKAYLHTMYVTVQEDKFASKYDFNEPEDMGEIPF